MDLSGQAKLGELHRVFQALWWITRNRVGCGLEWTGQRHSWVTVLAFDQAQCAGNVFQSM